MERDLLIELLAPCGSVSSRRLRSEYAAAVPVGVRGVHVSQRRGAKVARPARPGRGARREGVGGGGGRRTGDRLGPERARAPGASAGRASRSRVRRHGAVLLRPQGRAALLRRRLRVHGPYQRFGGGVLDVLLAPFTQPALFFSQLINQERLHFLFWTLAPLGFLPLFAWRAAARGAAGLPHAVPHRGRPAGPDRLPLRHRAGNRAVLGAAFRAGGVRRRASAGGAPGSGCSSGRSPACARSRRAWRASTRSRRTSSGWRPKRCPACDPAARCPPPTSLIPHLATRALDQLSVRAARSAPASR